MTIDLYVLLLLAPRVRRLASTRTKTCGDPPFARNSWMSFPGNEKNHQLELRAIALHGMYESKSHLQSREYLEYLLSVVCIRSSLTCLLFFCNESLENTSYEF